MSRHPTSTVRQRRRVRKPSMKHNTRRGGGEKKNAIQWTAEDTNILKALKEKKKTQFRVLMLKRYTSEEIRRAFGVPATDKRSDEELLDFIYVSAVGSSKFHLFISFLFDTLKGGVLGGAVGGLISGVGKILLYSLSNKTEMGTSDIITFAKATGLMGLLAGFIGARRAAGREAGRAAGRAANQGIHTLFRSRSPSKRKRHPFSSPSSTSKNPRNPPLP